MSITFLGEQPFLPYVEQMEMVQPIGMKEFGITYSRDSRRPILATAGLGPCVSVVGYDSLSHVGFLTHYSMYEECHLSKPLLLKKLQEACDRINREVQRVFDVFLVTGWIDDGDQSYENIKRDIVSYEQMSIRMQIVREILDPAKIRSLALDTRTGELCEFDDGNPVKLCEKMNYYEHPNYSEEQADLWLGDTTQGASLRYFCGEETLCPWKLEPEHQLRF